METLSDTRLLRPGRDLPWRVFFRRLVDACLDDRIDDVAASLTFYAVVALFPLLIVVFHVSSRIVSWTAIDEAVHTLARALPAEVTQVVLDRIAVLRARPGGSLITVSLLGALWSASAGVGSLVPALNRAYDTAETRPFWKRRLLALAVTLGVSGAMAVASLLVVALPILTRRVAGAYAPTLDLLRIPVAAVMIAWAWSALYAVLPNVRLRFRLLTPGSMVGVAVWLAVSWAFGLYVRYMGAYGDVYGAVGGVIVLLLWMWLSAMAFLLGAEVNSLIMPPRERSYVAPHGDAKKILQTGTNNDVGLAPEKPADV